ncbi:hypothetical protein Emtol_2534 [Emticicia oligotrophica DSM 17448]|uniref:Uncharacterized protein n=1 Tax=Emticicia oligotrophica (strain DSM 17448 / CIP 109782 / MTCC 6937 / GPTSA100-15) TaxID=929562 RepID=A0ABN4ANE8_EMTOG|nr:hypothetical protein [Emticicia oligotrophica]AFK03670.1 hypothetical protein Emtol_2534 [Emticicia oligotrophica DSM 17448]
MYIHKFFNKYLYLFDKKFNITAKLIEAKLLIETVKVVISLLTNDKSLLDVMADSGK